MRATLRLGLVDYFNRPWERIRTTLRNDLLTFTRDVNRRVDDVTLVPSATVAALDGTNTPGTSEAYARGDHKHDDPNRPSDDEKAALVGTDGTPDAGNPFVTDSDPRLAGSGITELTGDGTAGPGSGSQALTLAASGVAAATYGDATHVAQVTFDAKGRATAAVAVAITYPAAANHVVGEPFTGDGVTTAFVLAHAPTAGTVAVYLDGVRQTLTTAYTVAGSTVTFTGAPALGAEILIDYLY